MRFSTLLTAAAAAALLIGADAASAGPSFDAVKARGTVRCGVSTGLAGFSLPDSTGKWTGIDVDTCKAIAAAVFGDANKVDFVPLNAQQRFTALQSGEVDLLARNSTWTLTRDASLGLAFTGINFYDGQGFAVPKSLGVKSALELDGAEVCVQPGTTTELNLADFFRANNMTFNAVVIESFEQSVEAFFAGRCQVYTTDRSGLAAIIANDAPKPEDWLILPETISKEPLGPVVRRGDEDWGMVVKWTLFAMLEAEEYGLTSANVDEQKGASKDPVVQRLLGTTGDMGAKLGLAPDWGYAVVKQVGNYGESYERNVGPNSPLRLERGINNLWKKGGLMYAPPLR